MSENPVRVLVTGFGPFLDVSVNPSFEIIKRLPPSLLDVEIVAHPEPIKAVYHSILEASSQLIQQHNPTIVLHLGLACARDYFSVEQSAQRDGYHQYPDMERKVISKLEAQKIWGKKSAESLSSSFGLESVVEVWKRNLITRTAAGAPKGKRQKGQQDKKSVDLRYSDDVGAYVCGFLYYASLAELSKRNDGQRNAVFLHVPMLSGDLELETGKEVVLSLILALVASID